MSQIKQAPYCDESTHVCPTHFPQVTEAQLQSSGSVPGSRYTSFRPHLGLPSSSALPLTSTTMHTPIGSGLPNPSTYARDPNLGSTSYARDPNLGSAATPALSLLPGPGSGSNPINGSSSSGAPFVSKYISGMGMYGTSGAGTAQKSSGYQPANSPLRGGVSGGGTPPFGSGQHHSTPSAYSFGSDVGGGGSSQYQSGSGEGMGGSGGGASQYQYQPAGGTRGGYDSGIGGGGGNSGGYVQGAGLDSYSYDLGESTPLPVYRGGSYTGVASGLTGGGGAGLQQQQQRS